MIETFSGYDKFDSLVEAIRDFLFEKSDIMDEIVSLSHAYDHNKSLYSAILVYK